MLIPVPELKLYEYNNYGPGADMSGRANWVGIGALTPQELPQYTLAAVLGGIDNWDPTETHTITSTKWTEMVLITSGIILKLVSSGIPGKMNRQ
ncbi:MAG: hypothetical protein R2769_10895 [Saprospiraceae bacterium]